jgi:hypothetical protein
MLSMKTTWTTRKKSVNAFFVGLFAVVVVVVAVVGHLLRL